MRRRRDKTFAGGPFADPAWDALLDLYVAERGGRTISVTSACIGAATPSTTALRWLKHLEADGLVHRVQDPTDRRRTHVHLTARGVSRMDTVLIEAHQLLISIF